MAESENSRFHDSTNAATCHAHAAAPDDRSLAVRAIGALAGACALFLILALSGCQSKDIEELEQKEPTPTARPTATPRPTPRPAPTPAPIATEPVTEIPVAEDDLSSPVQSPEAPDTGETGDDLMQPPGVSDVEGLQDQTVQAGDTATTVTEPELPEGFPPDAPRIDGARITETYHEDQFYVLSLEADMRPMAVIAKYGNELRQAGWEYRRFQIEDDVKSLLYEKGDRFTRIEVYDGGGNERAIINMLVTAEEE